MGDDGLAGWDMPKEDRRRKRKHGMDYGLMDFSVTSTERSLELTGPKISFH